MKELGNSLNLGGQTFCMENPLIIAEIGTSHNGDINRAKTLIDAAFSSGASAVKFQIVYADEILHPDTGFVNLPTGSVPLYERFKELQTPAGFYAELASYARSKNLLFSATPFGIRSANELKELNPDFIKIASPELNYTQLLKHCAEFSLPMILSTGVSLLKDIEKAIIDVKSVNGELPLALLHCVTAYPAPESGYNAALIRNLKKIFNLPVGLSDHSMDAILVPSLSLAYGGFIIEKHICLSRSEKGLDDPVALEPEMFAQMCSALKKYSKCSRKEIIDDLILLNYSKDRIEKVIGTGEKKLSGAESPNYGRTNRSIHYTKNLQKGSVITKSDIAVLRTEKILSIGEAPEKFDFFIGAVLQRSVVSGSGVNMEDFIVRG
ncbi:N-acetylneuraminate synthase family protein [Treponema pedis]|uniref:N-acetylneuraminate synthase family protein n=1 Tax=Treponema pedis TaxID=409322 RepID=UPI000494AE9D|nr:N-acetylneuraminate synthase family protein [Treponema pedis]